MIYLGTITARLQQEIIDYLIFFFWEKSQQSRHLLLPSPPLRLPPDDTKDYKGDKADNRYYTRQIHPMIDLIEPWEKSSILVV